MDWFSYINGELMAERLSVSAIAEQFDTPLYLYSKAGLQAGLEAYQQPLKHYPHLICYAVKANSNLAVLNVLAKLGAGFDIVSVGELERVLAAGGDPARVVFSGVGKQMHEIKRGLEVGIRCFNVESETELERIQVCAEQMGKKAPISLRVNPDVDAQTHPYISTGLKENKFGIDIIEAEAVYKKALTMANIHIIGVGCHIGSQLTTREPFIDALDRLLALTDNLKALGITLEHVDIGGGLGVRYHTETPPSPESYLSAVIEKLKGRDLTLIIEPGRSIAAPAGLLLTRVELIKKNDHKAFAVVDAGMNDQLRPSMYGAWHDITAVSLNGSESAPVVYDVVGPICETGDFLGKERSLQIKEGDLLALRCVGAYGFVMSSNYNTRNRAAEVMVDGEQVYEVRRRETIAEQLAPESLLPTS
ncbi:diaminopimelate decarboxylase [Candidatus Sororendozoicomonas aggregata]|uniref:diaminopimelate decarboxylase n=1 Tax=Candidatus Sororendozoicomonas aggregata TaxID=3073239 RepID=UPI002ED1A43B